MIDKEETVNYYIANGEDDAGEFVIVCCKPSELLSEIRITVDENEWDLECVVIFKADDALKVKTTIEISKG